MAVYANTQHTTEPASPPAPAPAPAPGQPSPIVTIDIYLSLAFSIGAAGVSTLAIKKTIALAKQLQQSRIFSMLPVRETRRVQDLLAQSACLTRSDRAVLGIFHNGHLSSRGYHMENLAIAYAYESPGIASLPEFRRDIPVSEIMREMQRLWTEPTRQVLVDAQKLGEDNTDCALYLERRGLRATRLHLLSSGSTEVAILGFHYQDEPAEITPENMLAIRKIEAELTEIVRRASLQRPIWGSPAK